MSLVLLFLLPARLLAGSASANLAVGVTVESNCAISTSPLSFGSYDPIVANASSSLDGAGGVTISCTKGSTTSISLSPGSNAPGSGTSRALSNGAAKLSYEIYKDAGRAQVWGNSAASLFTPSTTADKAPRSFPAYGRIPSGQDVSTGSYADTVIATINF